EMFAGALRPDIVNECITRRMTEKRATDESLLNGRYCLWEVREEAFRQAIDYVNEVASKDPGFSLAYVGLADCYILQGVWGTYPPNEVFPRARAAAEKAIETDNESSEALTSLAFVEWVNSWDFPKADAGFRHS